MKLLSPAGNFDSLKTAVFNGADEIYLGINDFNARNNIDGFNMENLKRAVDFAHLFGVKVDLAINILFNDTELQRALNIVVDAYNFGVDGFIVQDLGLASLIHLHYPQVELHASTQMGIHNLEGVKFLEKFGFKRVVLSRETPIEEIKRIRKNSNIEIEYFVQGALCVSFSGNCYLSSALFNASGNRGKCKQLCRLPYTFEHNGKKIKSGYLLSAKDFNLINRLNDLTDAGVDVVKIEGRARRPEYVGLVTAEYRKAIDGKKFNEDNIKLAFNREYVNGYFNGNGDIISEFNNHIGIRIGKVLSVNFGKRFNEVLISTNRELSPKSTLKFFNSKNKEINTVSVYDLRKKTENQYIFTTTQKIVANLDVNLLTDYDLEKNVISFTRRKSVKIKIFANYNQPIKALFEFDGEKYEVLGSICLTAKNQPLSKKQLNDNFNKSEFFYASLEICSLDNVFITVKDLNEFRRQVFDLLYRVITENKKDKLNKINIIIENFGVELGDYQFVENVDDNFTAKNVVYSPEIYDIKTINLFIEKCKREKVKAYLDTPNFALKKDIELLNEIIKETGVAIVVNNYYAFCFDTEIIIGAGLNVFNSITAKVYNKPYIFAENSSNIKYKYPYMTFRHCPLKSHYGSTCDCCKFDNGFTYLMDGGKEFSLKRKKLSTCTFYLTD